ncbi:P-loop containing nucleoside triphosphate hydrolase protein [Phyllosticta citribraziliensis]
MTTKPVFVATHPRACSTAFERVFMTRRDELQCVHEPFGDAFYYGPERIGDRYLNDEEARIDSGFSKSTYKTIIERIDRENTQGKRIFIKDIAHYLCPPNGKPASIAPSLVQYKRGVGTDGSGKNLHHARTLPATVPPHPYPTEVEEGNPTVVPTQLLAKFHWTFLIRHPRNSIPSYFRCTVPPLDAITGFYNFDPAEAGYDELRRIFDYLKNTGLVGPKIAGQNDDKPATNGTHGPNGTTTATNGVNGSADAYERVEICVIDADDLLDNPEGILRRYCESIGVEFSQGMLNWNDEDQECAKEAFEKWKGFHEDAIGSKDLKPRAKKKIPKSDAELYAEWTDKFGPEGAKCIQDTVDKNVADYEYLKSFAMKV